MFIINSAPLPSKKSSTSLKATLESIAKSGLAAAGQFVFEVVESDRTADGPES